MSEENVEIVRTAYADPRGLLGEPDRIAEDAEFDFTAVYPDRPILRGADAVRRFREQGPWGKISFEPEQVLDLDDRRVLVMVRVHTVGKESGVPVEQRTAHLLTLRNGRVTGFKVFRNRAEALEAVGLGE